MISTVQKTIMHADKIIFKNEPIDDRSSNSEEKTNKDFILNVSSLNQMAV